MKTSFPLLTRRGMWSFPGLRVFCTYADGQQESRIRALWQGLFPCEQTRCDDGGASVFWELGTFDAGMLVSTGAVEVAELSYLKIFRQGSSFFLKTEGGLLRIAGNRARGHVDDSFWTLPLVYRREFFVTAMLILARATGLYGLHGSALQRANETVLLVGDSGSGKTTTSMALWRAGWTHLTDDVIVVRDGSAGVEAFPFRRGLSFTPFTLQWFSDLPNRVRGTWDLLTEDKWLWTPGNPTSRMHLQGRAPHLVLFTELGDKGPSNLIPVGKTDAVAQLIRQSAGIVVDGPSAATQLRCLSHLVNQAKCYRLIVRPDLISASATIGDLISRLPEEVLHE